MKNLFRGILAPAALATVLLLCWPAGCGNDDYVKPIGQFQDASAVVIAGARQALQQMNQVEENAEIDRQTFGGKSFDEAKIKGKHVITDDQIEVRVRALDQLSRYTSALANLAALKSPAQVTQQFQDVGSAFTKLGQDAEKLDGTQNSFFKDSKFTGAVKAATLGIGAVVRAVEEHRARHEIEKEIRDQDANVTALTGLLGDELDLAYQRRKAAEGEYKDFLIEQLAEHENNTTLHLLLAERYKDWHNRQPALAAANPQPSVAAMEKAHKALVAYANSDKSPKNLSELYAAAQDFFSRVQPFAQAMAALLKSA